MIQLTQQPAERTFAQNPVVFAFKATHTDGSHFAARGARQTIALTEGEMTPTGKILIDITEADGTAHGVVFSLSDTQTSPFHLPTWYFPTNPNFPTGDFDTYILRLSPLIQSNYLVSPFFTVTYFFDAIALTHNLIFTAIDPSVNFILAVQNLPNATVLMQEDAVSDSTPTNYAFVYEVLGIQANGLFAPIFEGQTVPDTEGTIRLNIQDIVAPLREQSPIIPPNCTNILPHKADNMRRYYLRYAEQSGAPTVRQPWFFGEPKTVLCGGIAQNLWTQDGAWFTESKLLNTLPDSRTVGAYDPEYLAYYNGTGATQSLQVAWQAWSRNDASVATGVNNNLDLIVGPGETLMIPAFIFHEYRDSTAALTIHLLDQNLNQVCPARYYDFDRRYREEIRFLMFVNQFGVFETVRMTGIATVAAEIDRRESSRFVGDVVETFEAEKRWKRSFTYRTGYMSEAELAALEGLLASRHVFEVSTTEGYIPLRIVETKKDLNNPNADMEAWEIKAVPQLDYGQPSRDLWIKW